MRYRSTSPVRFMVEVDDLSSTYKVCEFVAVDNIIDMRYSDTRCRPNVPLFYETKANQVAAGQGAVRPRRHQDPTTA